MSSEERKQKVVAVHVLPVVSSKRRGRVVSCRAFGHDWQTLACSPTSTRAHHLAHPRHMAYHKHNGHVDPSHGQQEGTLYTQSSQTRQA